MERVFRHLLARAVLPRATLRTDGGDDVRGAPR